MKETAYGIVFADDKEFKILAVWMKHVMDESLWDFANRIYEQKYAGVYEHYDTKGFYSLEEMNVYITEKLTSEKHLREIADRIKDMD